MAAQKSKILIIGGTGYIGKFIVEASAKASHPTFLLVRETTVNDPAKGALIQNFKNLGVTLLYVYILSYTIRTFWIILCFQSVLTLYFELNRGIFMIMRAW